MRGPQQHFKGKAKICGNCQTQSISEPVWRSGTSDNQLIQNTTPKVKNKLAKARKMRKPGTLILKKFGLSNLWVEKFGPKILAYLQYTFGKYTFRKYTFGKYTVGKKKNTIGK